MKHLIHLLFIAFIAALSSCQKDWNCNCYIEYDMNTSLPSGSQHYRYPATKAITNTTKQEANKQCEDYYESEMYNALSTSPDIYNLNVDCSI